VQLVGGVQLGVELIIGERGHAGFVESHGQPPAAMIPVTGMTAPLTGIRAQRHDVETSRPVT